MTGAAGLVLGAFPPPGEPGVLTLKKIGVPGKMKGASDIVAKLPVTLRDG